jgi:vacuolar protein sorting-associated protein 35
MFICAYFCFLDMQIIDDLKILEDYIVEEQKQGRSMRELYELVQYAGNIIPRIYMMITIGTAFVRNDFMSMEDMLLDLLDMICGIQNPLRGLFARYYLLHVTHNLISEV